MIVRRKLFGFLAASPVVAAAAIARAKEPSELRVDRIEVGDFEIIQRGEILTIRRKESDQTVGFSLLKRKTA